MSSISINLWLRFALELMALFGLGLASWRHSDGVLRWILVISVPVTAAALWGIFAVPDDPSRSGNAPIPVPGGLRLLLEFAILGGGAGAYIISGYRMPGLVMLAALVVHYAVSYDRVIWLLKS
jgi:hypothetical protein